MESNNENTDMEFIPLIPSVIYEDDARLVLVPGDKLYGSAARQSQGYPIGPPPKDMPVKQKNPYFNLSEEKYKGYDKISLKNLFPCRYRYTYIWLENGKSFWIWPTYIDRYYIAGFRWTRKGWSYFGLRIKKIEDFVCY